jgi:hypothetical protein
MFCYAKKETIFYFSIITFEHIVYSLFSAHFRQKKGKTEVLPYMSNNYDHYSAGVASSVAAGASVVGASASAAAFLGAAGALLRRVFLAGSAAVAIELP